MFECRKAKGVPQPEFRKCCACGETKHAATQFYWSVQKTGTYPSGRCKKCAANKLIEYRSTRKKKYADYAKAARKRNPESFKLRDKKSMESGMHEIYRATSKARRAARLAGTQMACKECGIVKSADSDFHIYNQPCKACHSAGSKKRALANLDSVKARRKRYYQENKEVHIRKAREWKIANPERVRKSNNDRAKTEEGRLRQRERNWDRRARLHGAKVPISPPVTKEWFLSLCSDHGHKCYYCHDATKPLTADHVVALANGGKHVRENIVPSCKSCNCRKSYIPVTTFAPWVNVPLYGLDLASA